MKKVSNEVYELISKDIGASINSIHYTGNDCYEVSFGVCNCTAYYYIVNNVIIERQFD